METSQGFTDQGIHWPGTRETLETWKAFKQKKALDFVTLGYSVSWYSDGVDWMEVYKPARLYVDPREIRAKVKFFSKPSERGIKQGRI